MVRVLTVLTVAAAALLVAAVASARPEAVRQPSSASFIGPFTGVATGSLQRDGFKKNDAFTSTSRDEYQGRFTYSFRIQDDGTVEGTGHGTYSNHWHLEGKVKGHGNFSCDPPVDTPDYSVDITGTLVNGTITLDFELVGAKEHNDDFDCGADFTAYESNTHYWHDGLRDVQDALPAHHIQVDLNQPKIPKLGVVEESGPSDDHLVVTAEWTFTTQGPSGAGGGSGGGGGGGGGSGGGGSSACTITGTAGNDVLVGTSHRDVICALGGDDVLRGLGENDILRGGPGNDTLDGGAGDDTLDGGPGKDKLLGRGGKDLLLARDATKDTVDGGAGSDRAKVDGGLDHVVSVETLL